jgi:hypothetical protein
VRTVKYRYQNEVGYISETMCDSVDKSFNYDALLLTCGFPEEACSLFFRLLRGYYATETVCVFFSSDGVVL